MISRRGFLGTLAAAMTVPLLKFEPTPLWTPTVGATPVIESAVVGLNGMTEAVARMIAASVDSRGVRNGDQLGSKFGRGVFTNQWGVDMRLQDVPDQLDRYGIDVDRYLKPTAASLSERIRRDAKTPTFGRLGFPASDLLIVSRVEVDGVCVRGIYQPKTVDLWDGSVVSMLRFDVLVG